MTEAISEALPLASDEEVNSLYSLIIPQVVLCWHHPHTSRTLQLILKRGTPVQQKALITNGLKGHVVRFACSTIATYSINVALSVMSPEDKYELAWELERGLAAGKLDDKDSLSQILAAAMEHLPSSSIPTAFRMTLDRIEDLCFQLFTRGTVIAFLGAAEDPSIVEASHLLSPLIPSLLSQRGENKEGRSIVKHLFLAVGRLTGRGRTEASEHCLSAVIQMQQEGLLHEHVGNLEFLSALKELNEACSSKQRARLIESLQIVLQELRRVQDLSGNHNWGLSSFEELVEGCVAVQAAAEEKKKTAQKDPEPSVAEKKAIEAAIAMSLRPMVNDKLVLARSDFGQKAKSQSGSDGGDQSKPPKHDQEVQEQQQPILTSYDIYPFDEASQSQSQSQSHSQLSQHEANQQISFHNPIPVPVPLPIPAPVASPPPTPQAPLQTFEDNEAAHDLFSLLIGNQHSSQQQDSASVSQRSSSFFLQTSQQQNYQPSAAALSSFTMPAVSSHNVNSYTPPLNQHVSQIQQATAQHLSLAAYPQASSQPLQPLHQPPSFDLTTLDEAMKMQQLSMIQQIQQQQAQALSLQQSGALAHQINPLGPPPPVLLLYPVPVPVVVVQLQLQPQLMTHASALPSIVYNAAQQQNSLAFAHPSTLTTPSSSLQTSISLSSMNHNQSNAALTQLQPSYNPFQR